jgi:hypothetical protein
MYSGVSQRYEKQYTIGIDLKPTAERESGRR